jgi:hypothetical protein
MTGREIADSRDSDWQAEEYGKINSLQGSARKVPA